MTKECKVARNTVLIPIIILVSLLIFCTSSCALPKGGGCGGSPKHLGN